MSAPAEKDRAPAADPLDTFPRLILDHARARPRRPAIREKDFGIWQTWTWEDAAREIPAFACGLAARGFRRGDRLAAGPEPVRHAEARAHVAQGGKLGCLCANEILGRGELHIAGLAFEGRNFESRPLGERRTRDVSRSGCLGDPVVML